MFKRSITDTSILFNVQRDAPITTDISDVRMREATTAEVIV